MSHHPGTIAPPAPHSCGPAHGRTCKGGTVMQQQHIHTCPQAVTGCCRSGLSSHASHAACVVGLNISFAVTGEEEPQPRQVVCTCRACAFMYTFYQCSCECKREHNLPEAHAHQARALHVWRCGGSPTARVLGVHSAMVKLPQPDAAGGIARIRCSHNWAYIASVQTRPGSQ